MGTSLVGAHLSAYPTHRFSIPLSRCHREIICIMPWLVTIITHLLSSSRGITITSLHRISLLLVVLIILRRNNLHCRSILGGAHIPSELHKVVVARMALGVLIGLASAALVFPARFVVPPLLEPDTLVQSPLPCILPWVLRLGIHYHDASRAVHIVPKRPKRDISKVNVWFDYTLCIRHASLAPGFFTILAYFPPNA